MSIHVACSCGQRFAAQPHLAGKQVKCPACGSPLAVPHANAQMGTVGQTPDPFAGLPPSGLQGPSQTSPTTWAQQPLAQQSMMYSPHKRKKKVNWKLPVIIICAIAGVAVIATVAAVLAINLGHGSSFDKTDEQGSVGESNAESRSGDSTESFFQRPPTNPAIIATDENWVSDPSLLDQLGPEKSINGYTVRLPMGFSSTSKSGLAKHGWRRKRPGGRQYESFFFNAEATEINEELIKDIEAHFFSSEVPLEFQSVQRGRLNGIPCWRATIEAPMPNRGKLYWCSYHMLDGNNSVVLEGICFSPPGSREYKLFETSLRTLKPAPQP